MKRILPIAVAVMALGCRRESPPLAGDWAGDIRHPAMTLPLEVSVEPSLDSAKISFRIWRLAGAPGRVSVHGDSLSIDVPGEPDPAHFRGTVRAGAWTGTASRGRDTAPFEVRRLEPLSDADWKRIIGTYRTNDGRLVGIGPFKEFGERPLLVDYASGRIGPLFPVARDRLLLGRSIVAPVFPGDTVELTRAADGAVSALRFGLAGEAPRTVTRLATRDEDITFRNDSVALSGTLTLPEGPGPFPAIVLIHGSNAQTRDHEGPWSRFFPGLGFAVLAYDKRGTGRSTGDWKQADFHALAADALAGVRALRARKDIRTDRVGLWGISQAGWILPLVAAAAPGEIGFMIVHAGTGTTVREQGILNYRNELRFGGLPDSAVDIGVRYRELDDSVTRTGKNLELVERYYMAHKSEAPWLEEPAPLDAWFRGYYRMLMDYDPAASWRKVTIPILLFFGELDANVPPRESWPPIQQGLAAAGNTRVAHFVLPSANHVLLEARTGARDEYPHLSRFVPGYFDRMAEWLAPFAR